MQTLLLPAIRTGVSAASTVSLSAPPFHHRCRTSLSISREAKGLTTQSLSLSRWLSFDPLLRETHSNLCFSTSPTSQPFTSQNDNAEKAKLAQVVKRLENTSTYFRRLGNSGFWGQLVCTVVAAVILSCSVVVTGKISSPATFYATAGGIAAAFISVFWSFGYIRLADKLRKTASDPSKAPPRSDVVKGLKSGIIMNLLGMLAAVLSMQATVGLLVAKALTSTANPYYRGIPPGNSPVLGLDVFLV